MILHNKHSKIVKTFGSIPNKEGSQPTPPIWINPAFPDERKPRQHRRIQSQSLHSSPAETPETGQGPTPEIEGVSTYFGTNFPNGWLYLFAFQGVRVKMCSSSTDQPNFVIKHTKVKANILLKN